MWPNLAEILTDQVIIVGCGVVFELFIMSHYYYVTQKVNDMQVKALLECRFWRVDENLGSRRFSYSSMNTVQTRQNIQEQ